MKRIKLIYPKGGEIWEKGESYEIQWLTDDFDGNIDISLKCGEGRGGWFSVARCIENTGRHTYKVPANIGYSNCLLFIESSDKTLKAQTGQHLSLIRPNDWDWTSRSRYHLYWEGGETESSVNLPWYEQGSPCYKALNNHNNPDILPEDGWVLLAKDFGSPARKNPDFPFFVLYNKYTALIRVFIYNGTRANFTQNANYTMGSMSISCRSPEFIFHTGKTLEDFDPDYEQIFITKHLIPETWTYLEFDVKGYDPKNNDLRKENSFYTFTLYGLNKADFEASGNLEVCGFIDSANMRTGYEGNGILDVVKRGKDAFLKAAGTYKTLSDGIDKMLKDAEDSKKKDAEDGGGDQQGQWWTEILGEVAKAGEISFLPGFGALAGFVTSAFSGSSSGSIPLSWRVELTGKLKLQGSISKPSPLMQFNLYIPGTVRSANDAIVPYYDKPLGLISFKNKPEIFLRWTYASPPPIRSGKYLYGFSLKRTAEIELNPHANLKIASVKAAFVGPEYEPTRFYVVKELLEKHQKRRSIKWGKQLLVSQVQGIDWSPCPKMGFLVELAPRQSTVNVLEKIEAYREIDASYSQSRDSRPFY